MARAKPTEHKSYTQMCNLFPMGREPASKQTNIPNRGSSTNPIPICSLFTIAKATQKKHKIGVSHCGLAIHINKSLKAKEELWKLKYFTMQKYNLQSNPLKETKLLQDIIITL